MGRQVVLVMTRVSGSSTTVQSKTWTEIQVNVPRTCRMRRVRAIITVVGGAAANVAFQLREVSGVDTGLPLVVDVPLTATPMSEGGPKYCIADLIPSPIGQDIPVLYVALKTDDVADSTVVFSVDFESTTT